MDSDTLSWWPITKEYSSGCRHKGAYQELGYGFFLGGKLPQQLAMANRKQR